MPTPQELLAQQQRQQSQLQGMQQQRQQMPQRQVQPRTQFGMGSSPGSRDAANRQYNQNLMQQFQANNAMQGMRRDIANTQDQLAQSLRAQNRNEAYDIARGGVTRAGSNPADQFIMQELMRAAGGGASGAGPRQSMGMTPSGQSQDTNAWVEWSMGRGPQPSERLESQFSDTPRDGFVLSGTGNRYIGPVLAAQRAAALERDRTGGGGSSGAPTPGGDGSGGPYDTGTRNAMFTQQASMAGHAAGNEANQILQQAAERGLSANDPAVQADLRRVQGGQAQAAQRARLGIDLVANKENYDARMRALNDMRSHSLATQQLQMSAEDRLRQMLMNEAFRSGAGAPDYTDYINRR